LTISHHPRLESRIAEARAKLGIIAARFDKFDDELHAMLAKELTVTEAGGYFRGLTGADLPHGTDRQKKTREKVFGQMLDNFDNDRNTLAGREAHRMGRVQRGERMGRPSAEVPGRFTRRQAGPAIGFGLVRPIPSTQTGRVSRSA
jgi:hypothetical protein